ncbi:MAG TPA: ABC transporter substrate-binding protein [Rhodopila sp.]|uniref:ABC transporter substrate-binding protein n=1 Tax=Rhodopila sp. TaxID=2480087 RepID=UPI002BA7FCA5|nr:ABC transporter substrate-binding protein [Rhodopila sp.]HVY14425.1 ABC transporter substrate-binding protein [Rhodopila sp.]
MHAHRLRRRSLIGSALAAPFLSNPLHAADLTPLRVRLDWTPWGCHAALHLANAKGWFRDAGLDVAIDDGNGTNQTVQIVGGGDDVDVGHAALSSMMIARDKGFKLRAVASYARNSDIGVMVPVTSSIRTIADLRGKRIGHTASSLETPFLGDFLKAGGLTKADIELVNLDGAAKLAAYLDGKLDGAFSSIPFFVPAVQAQRPSRGILLGDAGLRLPSYGLFAREETIAKKRDALTRLVSISDGAWAYIKAGHQDEGVAAIHAARPNAKLSPAVMRGQIDLYLTFFATPATKDAPIGTMAPADWQQAVATVEKAKLISTDLTPTDYYTNELFDQARYAAVAGTRT